MLAENLNIIIEKLDTNGTAISRAAGFKTPSSVNRIKGGLRMPPASSPTIEKLVDGIIDIARESGKIDLLCKICSVSAMNDKAFLRNALIYWLYSEEIRLSDTNDPLSSIPHNKSDFTESFDSLLSLSGLSNRQLSVLAGVDASYISRLKRGERIPKYNSDYIYRICEAALKKISDDDHISGLSALTGINAPLFDAPDAPARLCRWLLESSHTKNHLAVETLLNSIMYLPEFKASAPAAWNTPLADLPEIRQADTSRVTYEGSTELQQAVVRFLYDAISSHQTELLLYSDSDMGWMMGGFSSVLTRLMLTCIKMGMKIKIIHNIDRSLPELIDALKWWLPLYMTGNITSYHNHKSSGERFNHTVFISPGRACILSMGIQTRKDDTLYQYISMEADGSSDTLFSYAQAMFSGLLSDSSPLVELEDVGNTAITRPEHPSSVPDTDPDIDNASEDRHVCILLSKDRVRIARTSAPFFVFSFTHPTLISAFENYLKVQTKDMPS